ncbi:hypothetical protein EV424DRAFT_1346429 [Suillus variegatus]|nr:hypothetical protein EV424DRAFT_1346429 [Suillus variegatus]
MPLAIVPLQDAIATPASPSHGSMTNGTPLPSIKQPSPNPQSNCIIIIQNNYIAEGGTINIYSSHCNGSTTAKLERVTATAEPTPFKAPPAMQAETPEHGRESTVLSGNTFGECAYAPELGAHSHFATRFPKNPIAKVFASTRHERKGRSKDTRSMEAAWASVELDPIYPKLILRAPAS